MKRNSLTFQRCLSCLTHIILHTYEHVSTRNQWKFCLNHPNSILGVKWKKESEQAKQVTNLIAKKSGVSSNDLLQHLSPPAFYCRCKNETERFYFFLLLLGVDLMVKRFAAFKFQVRFQICVYSKNGAPAVAEGESEIKVCVFSGFRR